MRTRLSTQVAAQNLGLEPIVFNVDKDGWALEFEEEAIMSGNTVEHVKDAAPILGKYFDILCIRTFPSLKNKEDDYSELHIKQFIKYAGIPIVSLESATLHPLQSLTDIVTISECLANQKSDNQKSEIKNSSHLGSSCKTASTVRCKQFCAMDQCMGKCRFCNRSSGRL